MQKFDLPIKKNVQILTLGAESSGNFSTYQDGVVHFSEDFDDLLDEHNFSNFQEAVLKFLKENKLKPDVIMSDLHPQFHTTLLAQELAKKYRARYVPVQHHLAHIFSAIGDNVIENGTWNMNQDLIGIACDGTGYGYDEKIWGGEIFRFKVSGSRFQVSRVGHLENQILLGGEMAIKQPARLLISILSKFLQKPEVQNHVKKYYSKNEFEVLYNQLQQNFNCIETSSTARVLDAVSVLLEFSKNERLSKHGPIDLLEKNSTISYQIKPVVEFDENEKMWILKTTPLFRYLIKNLNKNKSRLAATAQKYIADGLLEITQNLQPTIYNPQSIFFAGGMANNKIISSTLESKDIHTNKKIPRGDAGLSFGQVIFFLLANPRD